MAEIVVIAEWESEGAVRAFAGDDIEAAVVAPEALALLSDADARVRHFDVVGH